MRTKAFPVRKLGSSRRGPALSRSSGSAFGKWFGCSSVRAPHVSGQQLRKQSTNVAGCVGSALSRALSPSSRPTGTEKAYESYLVDPASSHMLVSKIKPCMSKFTLFHGETANGSLNQSRFLR